MLQVVCPDGKLCPSYGLCCPGAVAGSYFCCVFGAGATCCSDGTFCCPPRHACLNAHRVCAPLTDSPALPVQAILLVNSIDKRGRDGTAGMDPKDRQNHTFTTSRNSIEKKWFHRHLWERFLP